MNSEIQTFMPLGSVVFDNFDKFRLCQGYRSLVLRREQPADLKPLLVLETCSESYCVVKIVYARLDK